MSDVKQAHSIESVVSQYAVIDKNGMACCPIHQEKTASFKVNADKGTAHCFGCGFHGDVISFVQAVEKLDFKEAIQKLGQGLTPSHQPTTSVKQQAAAPEVSQEQKQIIYAVNKRASDLFHASLNAGGKQYLYGRGVNDESIENFQLGYSSAHATETLKKEFRQEDLIQAGLFKQTDKGLRPVFYNRLMFPIQDEQGRCCGFGGRSLRENDKVKYLNTKETPIYKKSHLLYGESLCQNKEQVVITERYVDAIALHQKGFNAVALCGTALSDSQVARIERFEQVELAFDADNAGRQATDKALEKLPQAEAWILPQGQDAADFLSQQKEIGQSLDEQYNITGKYPSFTLPTKTLKNMYTDGFYMTESRRFKYRTSQAEQRDAERLLNAGMKGQTLIIKNIAKKYESHSRRHGSLNVRQRKSISRAGLHLHQMATAFLIHQKPMPKKITQQEQFNKLLDSLQKLEDKNWQQSWSPALSHFRSPSLSYRSNGSVYGAYNQFALSLERRIQPCSNVYIGFVEAKKHGWSIKKGEKGHQIIFTNRYVFDQEKRKRLQELNQKDSLSEQESKEKKDIEKEAVPFAKAQTVFSLDQTTAAPEQIKEKLGLEIKAPDLTNHSLMEQKRFAHAESILQRYFKEQGITFESTNSNRAFFKPSEKKIVVPKKEQFKELEEYYSTVFHEAGHSTGVALGREFGTHQKGKTYAKEELVAELTSLNLQQEYHFTNNETHTNSLKYLKGWLDHAKGKEDAPKVLFEAFKEAEKATDLIMGRNQDLQKGVEIEQDSQKEKLPSNLQLKIDEKGTAHLLGSDKSISLPQEKLPSDIQSKLITEAVQHGFTYNDKENLLTAPENETSQKFIKALEEKTLATHQELEITKEEKIPVQQEQENLASKVVVASVGFDQAQTQKFDQAVREKFDLKKEKPTETQKEDIVSQVIVKVSEEEKIRPIQEQPTGTKSTEQPSLLPPEQVVFKQKLASCKPEFVQLLNDHDFRYDPKEQAFKAPADSPKAQKFLKIAKQEEQKIKKQTKEKETSMQM